MDRLENRIREIRLLRGFGLNELARIAAISGAYLCDLEKGNRRGSSAVIGRIAEILGVKPADLYPGEKRAV